MNKTTTLRIAFSVLVGAGTACGSEIPAACEDFSRCCDFLAISTSTVVGCRRVPDTEERCLEAIDLIPGAFEEAGQPIPDDCDLR